MSKGEDLYNTIADSIKGGTRSQMFGCPCIKAKNGKAAFCLYKGDLVIKLDEEDEREALALDGNFLFAPKGGRPMGGGWVQIPVSNGNTWKDFAARSFAFVEKLEANPSKAKAAKKTVKAAPEKPAKKAAAKKAKRKS